MKRFALFFLFLSASKVFACLQGPDATIIQQTLNQGIDAVLCPNSVFAVTDPIIFPKDDLAIYTEGCPKDDTRALLRITGEKIVGNDRLTTAINAHNRSRIKIKCIQVDGSRSETDNRPYKLGSARGLIELGGANANDCEIAYVRAYNTRGWTTLHVLEGAKRTKVFRNYLGPAGRLLSEVWGDGISVAAEESEVIGNVIEDPTDGGIVVFGAPGSKIIGNTIRSKTRPTLGGINMVDYLPWRGSFEGTLVSRNSIIAQGNQVRIGIAMGPPIWTCDGEISWASFRVRGATISDNLFTGNRMGYGIAADNTDNWTIKGNITHAKHSGTPENRCRNSNNVRPDVAPFIQGASVQGFEGFYNKPSNRTMRSLLNLTDSGPRTFRNDSEFISQDVPEMMETGKTYPIRVTFKNTGTQTWSSATGHRFGMLNPRDNSTWGMGRVELPGTVSPGQTVTLEFNVQAPSTTGMHHLQLGTLQESVEWFGDVSNNVVVDVVAPPPVPKPIIESVKTITPLPIKGTYADLEVKAVHENGRQEDLTYHWQASTQNPAATQFSINDSTSAYQTRVQFVSTGTYSFTITVQNKEDKKATADISIAVVSALNQLEIKPSSTTVIFNQVFLFESAGYDQFKQPFDIKPEWKVDPAAGLIEEGLFTAGISTGTYSITAKVGEKIASAEVTIFSNVLGPAPLRRSTDADFFPVLELKGSVSRTAVIDTYPSKPGFNVSTYEWIFYPLKTVFKRSGDETSWQGSRVGIIRANTINEGRLDLSTISIQANRTYGLSVTATTKDNKRSRTTYQIIHIVDDNEQQIQPPAPPVIRIGK